MCVLSVCLNVCEATSAAASEAAASAASPAEHHNECLCVSVCVCNGAHAQLRAEMRQHIMYNDSHATHTHTSTYTKNHHQSLKCERGRHGQVEGISSALCFRSRSHSRRIRRSIHIRLCVRGCVCVAHHRTVTLCAHTRTHSPRVEVYPIGTRHRRPTNSSGWTLWPAPAPMASDVRVRRTICFIYCWRTSTGVTPVSGADRRERMMLLVGLRCWWRLSAVW